MCNFAKKIPDFPKLRTPPLPAFLFGTSCLEEIWLSMLSYKICTYNIRTEKIQFVLIFLKSANNLSFKGTVIAITVALLAWMLGFAGAFTL